MEFNNLMILKIIEFCIAIICIILWEMVEILSTSPLIVCGTIVGFTIICGVLLVGHILDSIVEKRLNALFSIIGCVLFIISGALVIDEWNGRPDLLLKERKRNAIIAGALMIINGIVFLVDAYIIYKKE